MKSLFLRWLVLTFAILITSYLMRGIYAGSFLSAFFAAAILGILNAFLRPILLFLTLPITFLTLGLFGFVVNAAMLLIVSGLIPGFHVMGFWSALLGSFLINVINWFIHSLIKDQSS